MWRTSPSANTSTRKTPKQWDQTQPHRPLRVIRSDASFFQPTHSSNPSQVGFDWVRTNVVDGHFAAVNLPMEPTHNPCPLCSNS